MADRAQRLTDLKNALHQYVDKEKTRISNEVSVLQDVLNGRTGGAGIQQPATNTVAAVAQDDLVAFLQG